MAHKIKKTILHVNQHVIRSNIKTKSDEPAVTVRTCKGVRRGKNVVLLAPDGTVLARLKQSINKPLSCGARVWLEAFCEVRIED